MSDFVVRSILLELLSKVVSMEELVSCPPNKKLKLAKEISTSSARSTIPTFTTRNSMISTRSTIPSFTTRNSTISTTSTIPTIPNRVSESFSDSKGPQEPKPKSTETEIPKFSVARKMSELKADRDHWKNLCLTSRSKVTT
jgi:hypothetical protein